MISTAGQQWIFLGCLLTGLIMGLVYEAGFILRFCLTALFKESKPSAPPSNEKLNKTKNAKFNKFLNAEHLPSVVFAFIIDIVFFGACFILILVSAKITADGQIFWFSASAYVLGFILERISLGIIVAKFVNLIYNTFRSLSRKLSQKFFSEKGNGKKTP